MFRLPAFLCLALFASQSFAIHKCKDAAGKTVYQDYWCDGGKEMTLSPASGAAQQNASNVKELTQAQKTEAWITNSQKERRLRELMEIWIPRASAKIESDKKDCYKAISALEADKNAYQQNLWGKTNAAQKASEIAAKTTQCDMQDRDNHAKLDALKKEAAKLTPK